MHQGRTRRIALAALAALVAVASLLVSQAATASAAPDNALRCRTSHDAGRACGWVLTVSVSGSGTVTGPGDPAISCREVPPPRPHRRVPSACMSVYAGGSVELTAVPDAGQRLLEWTGCDIEAGDHCTVTMSADRSVTATFVKDTRVLAVQVEGDGTVTSDPEAIECRAAEPERARRTNKRKDPCYGDFAAGSQVTLTAAPDAGQEFTGWSAPVKRRSDRRAAEPLMCSGTAPTCTFTMPSGNIGVRATFAPAAPSPYLLRVSTDGAGTGTVTTTPGGECRSMCWYPFDRGTTVTLTAVPDAGSRFAGFTGAPCPASPCTITMTESRYVTAVYDLADVPDTTAPETAITRGPRYLDNDHSHFRFSSSESGSTFQCSIDDAAAQDCVSGVDYPCLAPGRHTFRVWATDPAGNTDPTPAQRRFAVRDSGRC